MTTAWTARIAGIALATWAAGSAAQDRPVSPEPADHAAQHAAPATGSAAAPAAKSEASADHAGHTDDAAPKQAMLLPGYGNGGFTITTAVPQAQAFFSNGMELGAAFAHKAAVAAMAEAVRLDGSCAMCKWGQAYVTAPTINFGATAAERKPLLELAKDAASLAAKTGTPRERALTAALLERYAPGDPAKRDAAFAAAMKRVQAQWPEDRELAVLAADAIMVATFAQSDTPDLARLREAIPLLEGVLAAAPDHTPAIHFYIHATEILGEPGKAEAAADRLAALAPNASHLVHMPAHTWYWVGRYQDAAETNRRAVEIGKANALAMGIAEPLGVFGLPYHSHNVIYGLGGALMSGDSAIALDLARPLVAASAKRTAAGPISQLLAASGYFALARFDPGAVPDLAEPKLPYLRAAWHYARGEAAAWRGEAAGIEAAIAAIPTHIATGTVPDDAKPAEQMLGITREVLAGRLATLKGDHRAAAEAFTRAAAIEETPSFNVFTDPPAFWYPVRRDIAAALLAAGDRAGAAREAVASLKLRMKDPEAERILAEAGGKPTAVAVR